MKIFKNRAKGSWRHDGYSASAGCDFEYRLSLPAPGRRLCHGAFGPAAAPTQPLPSSCSAWARRSSCARADRFLSAALFCCLQNSWPALYWAAVIGAIFGTAGDFSVFLPWPSSARSPTPTAACSCPLAGTFGDDTDIAAQAILNINDGPFPDPWLLWVLPAWPIFPAEHPVRCGPPSWSA